MATHNDTGKKGEDIAKQYLETNGYIVKHSNWRTGRYEVDIIAEKDNWLIFVEVKTRAANFLVNPIETINKKKKENLVEAARAYIRLYDWQGNSRFDIIGIIFEDNNHKIEHIEDAFFPTMNGF
jgi:Predicted endonuclease distantly related to archaeal Holliday junction resolvase